MRMKPFDQVKTNQVARAGRSGDRIWHIPGSEIQRINVERMNRTIKEATVKRSHDDGRQQLERYLNGFINACN